MKATEIKETGYYWLFDGTWTLVEVTSRLDGKKFVIWHFGNESEDNLEQVAGDLFGPLKFPGAVT